MYLRTSYEEAIKFYPEAVAQALAQLRASKSKHKDAAPEEMEWTFSSCLVATSTSLGDMLGGKKPSTTAPRRLTLAQKVKDKVARTHVVLMAKMGKGAQYCSGQLPVVPDAIVAQYRRSIAAEEQEAARVASLPPDERRREVAEAVRLLGRSSGFVAVSMPKG